MGVEATRFEVKIPGLGVKIPGSNKIFLKYFYGNGTGKPLIFQTLTFGSSSFKYQMFGWSSFKYQMSSTSDWRIKKL